MENKKIWLGILVIVLAFGMMACDPNNGDDGSTNGGNLTGTTWEATSGFFQGMTLVFLTATTWEMREDGQREDWGTYTVSGNNVTMKSTPDGDTISGVINGNNLTVTVSGFPISFTKRS